MIELPAAVSGHFHVIKRSGSRITEERRFDNLVMTSAFSNLISRLRGNSAWHAARFLFLGRGDTEPTRYDPGLEQRRPGPGKQAAGVTYSNTSNPPIGVREADVRLRFEFAPGEATGKWSEFGAADDADYTTPYNRALILDEAGIPVPLIVLSHESLTVYMTLRLREGLRFPVRGSITAEGRQIGYTLTPTVSRYWFNSSYNAWSTGYAHRVIRLLNASGARLGYLSKDTRMPWPFPAGSASTTIYPVETVTHHLHERRTQVDFALTHSEHDVEIHGVEFSPTTSLEDRIYHLTLDEPIVKKALNSINLTLDIAFSRPDTD